METPFIIGQTYWKPNTGAKRKDVLCDVCYGKKEIVITLGNGDHVAVQCAVCAPGYGSPTGYVNEYDYEIGATPFTIASVSSFHSSQGIPSWALNSTTGEYCYWENLYMTKEEALGVSQKMICDELENNMKRKATTKADMLRKKTWTVQYHGRIIKDLLRQLEWHKAKVWQVKNSKGDLS